MSTTPLSNNYKIDALLSTTQWGSSNGNAVSLTYSFPDSGSTWLAGYGASEPFAPNSYGSLTQTQRQDFREALAVWSDVANITFTETSDTVTQGDIRVAFSSVVTGGTAGYSYGAPSDTESGILKFSNGRELYASYGDVWLNTNTTNFSQENQDGFATLVHELGHSLGLKHPFTAESANSQILVGSEDSNKYSIMSYTSYDIGYKPNGGSSYLQASGYNPMLYDIAAMQFLYGANTTTRSGDTTYTFSNSEPELKTIWDGGGNDTFDLSNQTLAMVIDLNAGNYSSLGIKYVVSGGFIASSPVTTTENIAIAYNVDIENAIGGSGNDTLIGNNLSNQLTGGGGNDTLTGGGGEDTAIYSGNKADYTLSTTSTGATVKSNVSSEGTDTLTGVEKIQFKDILVSSTTFQQISNATTTTTPTKPTTPSDVLVTTNEGNSNQNHINYFLLSVDSALSVDVSVSYTTRDGTAKAGEDYLSSTGTATLMAGQTSVAIAVEIIGDASVESDETFMLAISNFVGVAGPIEIVATHTIANDDFV